MNDISVAAVVRSQLNQAGVTPYRLLATSTERLMQLCQLPSEVIEEYKRYLHQSQQLISAHDLYIQKMRRKTITTGNHQLDELLMVPEYFSTGLRQGDTYEIYGEPRAGKTQLMHQLAVTTQLPRDLGGVEQEVLWIDSEGSFSPSRIGDIGRRLAAEHNWDCSTEELLRGIQICRANCSSQQLQALRSLEPLLSEDPQRFGMLVVDSLTSHLRAEFPGQHNLVLRQQQLNTQLAILSFLASSYDLTVVVTNQVLQSPEDWGKVELPVGGHIMGHWAHHRLLLQVRREQRLVRIVASPIYPELQAYIELTKGGLVAPTSTYHQ